MTGITIRDLGLALERKLRARALENNRSMEDEAGDILRIVLSRETSHDETLIDAIRNRIEPFGGIELVPAQRSPIGEPPTFG